MTCDTCRYATPENGTANLVCRRYPPVPRAGHSDARWPRVQRVDWCGEYKLGAQGMRLHPTNQELVHADSRRDGDQ